MKTQLSWQLIWRSKTIAVSLAGLNLRVTDGNVLSEASIFAAILIRKARTIQGSISADLSRSSLTGMAGFPHYLGYIAELSWKTGRWLPSGIYSRITGSSRELNLKNSI